MLAIDATFLKQLQATAKTIDCRRHHIDHEAAKKARHSALLQQQQQQQQQLIAWQLTQFLSETHHSRQEVCPDLRPRGAGFSCKFQQ